MPGLGTVIKRSLQGLSPSAYKAAQKTDEIAQRMDEQKTNLPEMDMEAMLRDNESPGVVESPAPMQPGGDIPQPSDIPDLSGTAEPGRRGLNTDFIQTEADIEAYMGQVSETISPKTRSWDKVAGADHREVLKSMIGRDPYAGFSDRQLFALRNELLNRAEDLHSSGKWATENADRMNPEMYAELIKKTSDFVAFQRYAQGASAEAARALNSMKMMSQANGADRVRNINNILMTVGGDKRGKQLAEMLGSDAFNDDPSGLAGAARSVMGGNFIKPLVEVWVNGLLSGPGTPFINGISNTMVSAYETMAIKPLASGIGKIRTSLSGGEGNIKALEVASEAYGAYQGWVDGMRLFAKEIANQDYYQFGRIDKVELDNWHHVSSKNWNMDPQSKAAQAVDFIGDWYVRVPGRILQGQDQWFKSMSYRKNLNALAYRKAILDVDDGLIPESDISKQINAYVNNPTMEMHDASLKRAEYETFTNPPDEQGGLVGDAAMAIHKFSYRHPTFKLIIPFVRTPANLLNYAVENGLPPLRQKFREDLMAGGIRTDMAMARMSMASMMGMTLYSMHDSGQITGDAPDNPRMRELMVEQGIPANSININGKWWKYDRADPFGMMIAAYVNTMDSAAYAQEEDSKQEMILGMVVGMAQDFTDKSYMMGISELVDVVNSDEVSLAKSGSNYVSGIMGSFIPAWANYIAKSMDINDQGQAINRGAYKYTLDDSGIWDSIGKKAKTRTPWMREDLPIIRNWKGEMSVKDQGGWASEAFPIKVMNPKSDPMSYHLYKAGIRVQRPRDVVRLSTDEKVSLLGLDHNQGHVYWKYAEFIGQNRAKFMGDIIVSNDDYDKMTPEERGPGSIYSQLMEITLNDGASIGKIEFESWYRDESIKHDDWIQPDSIEWIDMVSKLDKISGEAYIPPGSEPKPEPNMGNELLRIMQ